MCARVCVWTMEAAATILARGGHTHTHTHTPRTHLQKKPRPVPNSSPVAVAAASSWLGSHQLAIVEHWCMVGMSAQRPARVARGSGQAPFCKQKQRGL